ncbi:hypothetical protein V8E53_000756 [Lactarius tabidus]
MNAFCQRLALLSFLAISLFSSTALATSVLAIDYGSDFIKASLMKPGMPFDVLLNKDSKRKIRSSVAWKNGERLFGQDAFNIGTRFPKDSYNSLKYLLGVPANADVVAYHSSFTQPAITPSTRFTAGIPRGTRKTVTFRRKNDFSLAFSYKESPASGFPVNFVALDVEQLLNSSSS